MVDLQLTGNETLEEGLVAQVGVVLLEVLLGGGDELDGLELEATLLEAGDDVADKATLDAVGLDSDETVVGLGVSWGSAVLYWAL